jgi:hypothetical protein
MYYLCYNFLTSVVSTATAPAPSYDYIKPYSGSLEYYNHRNSNSGLTDVAFQGKTRTLFPTMVLLAGKRGA